MLSALPPFLDFCFTAIQKNPRFALQFCLKWSLVEIPKLSWEANQGIFVFATPKEGHFPKKESKLKIRPKFIPSKIHHQMQIKSLNTQRGMRWLRQSRQTQQRKEDRRAQKQLKYVNSLKDRNLKPFSEL
jgi:hypothetical protein